MSLKPNACKSVLFAVNTFLRECITGIHVQPGHFSNILHFANFHPVHPFFGQLNFDGICNLLCIIQNALAWISCSFISRGYTIWKWSEPKYCTCIAFAKLTSLSSIFLVICGFQQYKCESTYKNHSSVSLIHLFKSKLFSSAQKSHVTISLTWASKHLHRLYIVLNMGSYGLDEASRVSPPNACVSCRWLTSRLSPVPYLQGKTPPTRPYPGTRKYFYRM